MVQVVICVGSHCALLGALNILDTMEELEAEYPNQIKVEKVKCIGSCDEQEAPIVKIDDEIIYSAKSHIVVSKVMERIK